MSNLSECNKNSVNHPRLDEASLMIPINKHCYITKSTGTSQSSWWKRQCEHRRIASKPLIGTSSGKIAKGMIQFELQIIVLKSINEMVPKTLICFLRTTDEGLPSLKVIIIATTQQK